MSTVDMHHHALHGAFHESRRPDDGRVLEEVRKLLVMAGAFFFIAIVCVMSKLQVGTEDVLRWSPIVWLVGVCIIGGILNAIYYCREKQRQRKHLRRLETEQLLFSLPFPHSFPILEPIPHQNTCINSEVVIDSLPSYADVIREKCQEEQTQPPNYATAIAMLSTQYV